MSQVTEREQWRERVLNFETHVTYENVSQILLSYKNMKSFSIHDMSWVEKARLEINHFINLTFLFLILFLRVMIFLFEKKKR